LFTALAYVAIPFGLFLTEVAVASPMMLTVYLVCAIGLLSSVGVYMVGSLIRTMVLEQGDGRVNPEAGPPNALARMMMGVDRGSNRTE
jgi:hypothetical protein